MLAIPLQTKDHINDGVVLILDNASLERMKEGDPAELRMKQLTINSGKMLLQPNILIAYENEEGMVQVNNFIAKNDIIGLLKYLQRGFQFRPDKGDHDKGPQPIVTTQQDL